MELEHILVVALLLHGWTWHSREGEKPQWSFSFALKHSFVIKSFAKQKTRFNLKCIIWQCFPIHFTGWLADWLSDPPVRFSSILLLLTQESGYWNCDEQSESSFFCCCCSFLWTTQIQSVIPLALNHDDGSWLTLFPFFVDSNWPSTTRGERVNIITNAILESNGQDRGFYGRKIK